MRTPSGAVTEPVSTPVAQRVAAAPRIRAGKMQRMEVVMNIL
jgi:hypothetical protein